MTNPDMLLLDEVSLGLSPLVVDRVYANRCSSLIDVGTTIVLVEQDLAPRDGASPTASSACWKAASCSTGRRAAVTREQVTEAYFGLHRTTRPRGAASMI